MKRFILKSSCFLIPFLIIILLSNLFYSKKEGDLIRIGDILRDPTYRKNITEQTPENTSDYLFTTDFSKKKKYDVLLFGDSFLPHFIPYLENEHQLKCLYWGNSKIKYSDNPIQNLIMLLNGDILSSVKVDYIVLESVERQIISRIDSLDYERALFLKDIDDLPSEEKATSPASDSKLNLKFLKVLGNSIIRTHASCRNDVYRFDLTEPLFSDFRSKRLFCYIEDIKNRQLNNNKDSIEQLNNTLNALSALCKKKEIELIILPAPDKYSTYFDYIKENEQLEQPRFFSFFNTLPKDYIYINSKAIFDKELEKRTKNLYHFDDTHWSPIGSQIISSVIADSIMARR